MKKTIYAFFLQTCIAILISSVTINAQVTVANEKINVIYLGLNNPMSFSVFDIDCKDVEIWVNDVNIQKMDQHCDKFTFTPDKVGTAKFSFFKITPEGRELIHDQVFKVIHPPLPDKVYLVVLKPGELDPITEECCANLHISNSESVSITELQNAKELGLTVTNFDFDISYRFTRYKYSILRNGEKIATESVSENKFLDKWNNHLKGVRPNDLLVFHDIFVRYYKEEIRLEDFIITVK